MLFFKRNIHFNELLRCDISGLPIGLNDYYYEDDEDGTIIRFDVYQRLKRRKKRERFDYDKLQFASSQLEYREALRQYEQDLLERDILEREVYKGV